MVLTFTLLFLFHVFMSKDMIAASPINHNLLHEWKWQPESLSVSDNPNRRTD